MKHSGTSWSLEYENGIIVGRFEKGMPLFAFAEEVYPAFEELSHEHRTDIVGTVDLIELDESLGKEIPKIWHQTTRKPSNLPNFQRAAFIANGLDVIILHTELSKLNIEIKGFDDDLNEAIKWARGDTQ